MNLNTFAGTGSNRSSRRRKSVFAPVAAETFEQRSLLTTPTVLLPIADSVVTTARPEISWEAVDNAVSYDIWISDADSRTIIQIQNNIAGTSYIPTVDLNQSRIRVWVRANLAAGPAPDWSSPHHFRVQVVPTLTGPENLQLPGTPFKIDSNSPQVTWAAAPGSASFELWVDDLSTGTYQTFNIANQTPVLDSEGDPVLDGGGNEILQEIRSFSFPTDLDMGRYRVWIRTTDAAGRVTRWSSPLNFEVAPQVDILRPTIPTLHTAPLLQWTPVQGATHYDLWVDGPTTAQLYRWGALTTTSFQIPQPLGSGTYKFWVRAIFRESGQSDVTGIWSNAAEFSKATRPIITGPLGTDGFEPGIATVTDIRPTLEWIRFDGAARYDVWVDRGFGLAGFIRDTSSTNTYTFKNDIQPGRYAAWVRAVSATGVATPWSPVFEFYATGGSPIILSPLEGSVVDSQPTITWTPVDNAASYELWIAWVGVDNDYYLEYDIPTASHTVQSALPSGSYRIWVRAILANGTAQNWSKGVNVTVAENEQQSPADFMLTSLLNPGNRQLQEALDDSDVVGPSNADPSNADPSNADPSNADPSNAETEMAHSAETDDAELSTAGNAVPSDHPSLQFAQRNQVIRPTAETDGQQQNRHSETLASLVGNAAQVSVQNALETLAEQCAREEWWTAE